jgi:arylsulfotransferase ASST
MSSRRIGLAPSGAGRRTQWSRRDFLRTSGAAVLGSLVLGATACGPFGSGTAASSTTKLRKFRSRPDLTMPAIQTATPTGAVAPGHTFVTVGTPKVTSGPLIVDNSGDPIWFQPVPGKSLADFKVQQYGGQSVLTWWEGTIVSPGFGRGQIVIADTSYRVLQQVTAAHGYQADLHEFLITPAGTALLTAYNQVPADLSSIGGSRSGSVLDGVVQEIDLSTGAPVFEWHSLQHVGLEDSYSPVPKSGGSPFDYFHINSIELDTDGNLLVSARNTWTVYKIDRRSGEVIWRLGGKKSSFTMGTGTNFEWQHDARRQPDGSITLFDDAASPQKEPRSRGLLLHVDESARTASLVREYTNYGLTATSQGNVQLLPNGNVFIGWGALPNYTEFDAAGAIVLDARFLSANQSYRAYKQPWSGRPSEAPAIAAERGASQVTVYASWNGATEVARWQVLAGPDPQPLTAAGSAPRRGFETAMAVKLGAGYVAAQALDATGTVLGTSRALKI